MRKIMEIKWKHIFPQLTSRNENIYTWIGEIPRNENYIMENPQIHGNFIY